MLIHGFGLLHFLEIKFQCMGSWMDPQGNIYSGLCDVGKEVYRERFRCMVSYDMLQSGAILRFL